MPRYSMSIAANSALVTVFSGRKSASPSGELVHDIYPFLQAKIIASHAKLSSESVGRRRDSPENTATAQSATANTESARVNERDIRFFIFTVLSIYRRSINQI